MFIQLKQNDAIVYVNADEISSITIHEQEFSTRIKILTKNGSSIVDYEVNKKSNKEQFDRLMSDIQQLEWTLKINN